MQFKKKKIFQSCMTQGKTGGNRYLQCPGNATGYLLSSRGTRGAFPEPCLGILGLQGSTGFDLHVI